MFGHVQSDYGRVHGLLFYEKLCNLKKKQGGHKMNYKSLLIDITTTFAVISWKKEAYRIMIADKIKNARTILYYITK